MNGLQRWGKFVPEQMGERFAKLGHATFRSARDGSALTGAPGVPVGRGDLYESYVEFADSTTSWVISSDSGHAVPVEEGINRWGPVTFKTGGPRSMLHTTTNWGRLVEVEYPNGWADR